MDVGGHNYLEPASWGVPVISGPYRHNFANIAAQLSSAGALRLASDSEALADEVLDLLGNSEKKTQSGAAGQGLLEANQGASEKLLALIESRLS